MEIIRHLLISGSPHYTYKNIVKAAIEQNDLNHTAHHSAKNNQLSLSILAFTGIKEKISIVPVVSQRNIFLHLLQGKKN